MRQPGYSILQLAGLGLLLTCICGPSIGQQSIDVPLAAPLAGIPETVFTGPDAFAVSQGDRISLVRGLPLQPIATEIVLGGSATPASRLVAVAPTTALYRAAGSDGIPGTSDDVLAVIRNVLESPQIEVTTISLDASVDAFVGASAAVAVVVDAANQRILVVRHATAPVVVDVVTAPVPLAEGGACGLGRVNDDAVAAASPGADLLLGTSDDRLLILEGLMARTYSFNDQPMPGAPQGGFLVTESGVGVSWVQTSGNSVELYLVREGAAGAAVLLVPVQVAVNPSPTFFVPCSVTAGFGDTVLVRCDDDVGRGTGNVLVTGLSDLPVARPTLYDNRNAGQESVLVSETEFVQFAATGPTIVQIFDVRTQPWAATTLPFQFDSPPGFVKLTGRSMVGMSTVPGLGATAITVSDLLGQPVVTPSSGSGEWAQLDANSRTVVHRLSRGLAAALVAHGGAVDTLRILTVPVIERLGPGKITGPSELDLVITPTVPNAMGPITLTITPFTPSPSLIFVLATRQSSPSTLALGSSQSFADGSLLHLGLVGMSVTEPLMAPIAGLSLALDPIPVASQILGQEYHVQAVVYDATGYYALSDAFLVVPN